MLLRDERILRRLRLVTEQEEEPRAGLGEVHDDFIVAGLFEALDAAGIDVPERSGFRAKCAFIPVDEVRRRDGIARLGERQPLAVVQDGREVIGDGVALPAIDDGIFEELIVDVVVGFVGSLECGEWRIDCFNVAGNGDHKNVFRILCLRQRDTADE